nr:glutamate--tRNA ligase cytoplasmic [Tanacetum cinerariifolium]
MLILRMLLKRSRIAKRALFTSLIAAKTKFLDAGPKAAKTRFALFQKHKQKPFETVVAIDLSSSRTIMAIDHKLVSPAKRPDFETWQINEWLKYAPYFSVESDFDGACAYADRYLLHHTYLVGKSLSDADTCVWSHLTAAGKRWESFIESKNITELILRFDDTNPEKESNEYVQNILKDVNLLRLKFEKVTYTSDYFPQLIKMAEKLIQEGKGYVDDTPCDQMKNQRMDGIDSKCRNNTVDENRLWEEMKNGSERGRMCCLRGKLDMKNPNNSLKDPVYYRCNSNHSKPVKPHHRTGYEYKVYPTYDFACPFVDALKGASKNLNLMEWDKLWNINKKIIDPVCPRRTAVLEKGHKKVTWLPDIDKLVPLSLVEFGHLITKKKLGDKDFTTNEDGEKDVCSEVLNEDSKETAAVGDANMSTLECGDIVQLERKGYFRCDVPMTELSNRIVLYAIPDGRQDTTFFMNGMNLNYKKK